MLNAADPRQRVAGRSEAGVCRCRSTQRLWRPGTRPPDRASSVERLGVSIILNAPSGVFTPFTVEMDGVAFSDHPELSSTFASTDGGFQLVEADGAVVAGATLEQVDD
jgi:hypothetical protein